MNTIRTFITNIEFFETMDEIRKTFESVFSEIVQFLETNKHNKRNLVITRVFEIIEEQYRDKNLSLPSIADKLNMSSAYLGRQIKEITGKSVLEHINDIRMAQVKQLLDTSNLSTKEIIEKCGLEDTNYFYTMFKKHFGMPLSQYKQSGKGEA